MKYLVLLALVGCSHVPPAPAPVQSANTSLCACRALCAPDNYSWTLTWVGGATPGGQCVCQGPLGGSLASDAR